jgi:catechol 2,3-dioxygenase-like lactoylglutathione lyase family enzyme
LKLTIAILLCSLGSLAAVPGLQRPHIVGVSHLALFVHDIAKSRAFYEDFLGFAEPYSLTNKDGGLHLVWIKINDWQTIELFPEKTNGSDRLNHIAIETDDADGMRCYLLAKGIVVPTNTPVGKIGNANYMVSDPDGHNVEVVQYLPDSWTRREQGKFLPDTRISGRIMHVGILVSELEPALKFYRDVLGGTETWRGSRDSKELSWVNVKLPESDDYIEFMLYNELPPPDQRGKSHHVCLEVPDVEKARATLAARAAAIGYTKPMEVKTGINRRRQLNLWDPDGTRIEIMETNTVDGVPAPSSEAPPPNDHRATSH